MCSAEQPYRNLHMFCIFRLKGVTAERTVHTWRVKTKTLSPMPFWQKQMQRFHAQASFVVTSHVDSAENQPGRGAWLKNQPSRGAWLIVNLGCSYLICKTNFDILAKGTSRAKTLENNTMNWHILMFQLNLLLVRVESQASSRIQFSFSTVKQQKLLEEVQYFCCFFGVFAMRAYYIFDRKYVSEENVFQNTEN